MIPVENLFLAVKKALSNYPSLTFIVPGKPQAKGRPRSFAIKKAGKFAGVRNVTPEATRRYEAIVRDKAEGIMLDKDLKPLQGRAAIYVRAYWEWPKSKFKKSDPRPSELFMASIDGDNNLKAVSDALNSICYLDDKQLVTACVEKWRAKQGEAPRVEVTIWSLDNEWSV